MLCLELHFRVPGDQAAGWDFLFYISGNVLCDRCVPKSGHVSEGLHEGASLHFILPAVDRRSVVRWNEIEEQIDHRCLNETEIADGICRFVKGLFKKLIFANGLGKVADHVFALNIEQYGMAVAWLGAVCYALQIFYDFSGYSVWQP